MSKDAKKPVDAVALVPPVLPSAKLEVAKAAAPAVAPPAQPADYEVTFNVRVGYNGKKFEAGQKYRITPAQLQALHPFVTRS